MCIRDRYRNVCAHGERLFTYRTVDAIADTPLHKKLSLPQSGNQYEKGKQDLLDVYKRQGRTGVVLLCCEISIRRSEEKGIEGKLSRN